MSEIKIATSPEIEKCIDFWNAKRDKYSTMAKISTILFYACGFGAFLGYAWINVFLLSSSILFFVILALIGAYFLTSIKINGFTTLMKLKVDSGSWDHTKEAKLSSGIEVLAENMHVDISEIIYSDFIVYPQSTQSTDGKIVLYIPVEYVTSGLGSPTIFSSIHYALANLTKKTRLDHRTKIFIPRMFSFSSLLLSLNIIFVSIGSQEDQTTALYLLFVPMALYVFSLSFARLSENLRARANLSLTVATFGLDVFLKCDLQAMSLFVGKKLAPFDAYRTGLNNLLYREKTTILQKWMKKVPEFAKISLLEETLELTNIKIVDKIAINNE